MLRIARFSRYDGIDNHIHRALVSATMKVLFDMTRGQISIEGDGPELIEVLKQAREIAPKLAEIRLITGPSSEGGGGPAEANDKPRDDRRGTGHGQGLRGSVPTLREFSKKISPTNVAERIITVAYYHARYNSQDTFSPKEMSDWFVHSGFERPSQMPVALFTTKKRYGYLENPGHGRWKLTVAGENAVTRKLEEGPQSA
jgi:hypothetical protein